MTSEILLVVTEMERAGLGHLVPAVCRLVDRIAELEAAEKDRRAARKRYRKPKPGSPNGLPPALPNAHQTDTKRTTNGSPGTPSDSPSDLGSQDHSGSVERISDARTREGGASGTTNGSANGTPHERIHCGDVVKIWNAVIRHAPIEDKRTNYQQRTEVAEWANDDPTGTGLPPRELLITALRAFAGQVAMQQKGYPFLLFAAQPSSFLAQSRGANGKPVIADRTGMKGDDTSGVEW